MVNQRLKCRDKLFTVLLLSAPMCVYAQGTGWDFQWQQAEAVNQIPLLPVTAEVVVNPKAQQALALPFAVHIAAVYVQSGQQVKSGEPLFKLSGAMVQSFAERLEIAGHHAKAASERIRNNQQRYAAGDILREQWLEWQHQAHQTALDYADLQQQQQHIQQWRPQISADGMTLVAASAGSVRLPDYINTGAMLAPGTELLSLRQSNQTLLEFSLPAALQAVAVSTPACTLPVQWASIQVQRQYRLFRTGPATAACDLSPGQRLTVQPWQPTNGFKLPREAILQTADGDAVIAGPDQPVLVPVRVLGRSGDWVYLQAELTGKQIATQDVAALKGQLQGMGGAE